MTAAEVLHLSGPILTAAGEEAPQAWVVGGRITFERPTGSAPTRRLAGYALPGLADLHCHIGINDSGEGTTLETAREQMRRNRDTGVLLIRDAGSIIDNSPLQATAPGEAGHLMPDLVRCGRHVARTRRYLIGYADEVDPQDLPAAVTTQAERSDGWVKIVGDWIDRDKGDLAPCWSADDFRAAADAAHAAGARITAHTFDEETIPLMLQAGFDCLEHATGLTDETIPAVAEAGIPVVTTLVNVDRFTDYADQGERKFPQYAAHMRRLRGERFERTCDAVDAGVQLLSGTDSGGVLGHGIIHDELDEIAKCGLSAEQILDAAVFAPHEFLRKPGLVEGAPANLIVTAEDPRRDHRALRDLDAIMLRGEVVGG
ncbi:amidohydrolase family protein [Helcobacillus massiliensis]|uniref:Imidazolonepropionase-like amidohydrolase n=1 Tax=Helcobacillus massiliensis TaxID=521392 RepID=A0A839QN67_9MICO|nr:imidazolonepropionase-like amidohydrolase [Helcobacillus massiliensis]